ncbi:hypothetical protein OE749_16480 [Aestuariibacter sp. AA17]|uniref:Major facilitator superfamily (MFS) profile domain-containing protein n=1 Tax=Fluctibacter corallii TaxID=2984329 RepID=A0ABT3ACI6_9ALTE|nr:hypothetical protein [Aestuariibacter sp. AA17]MCV2886292.1 hypothetical protein [Aestuariibacter sp. AA17]
MKVGKTLGLLFGTVGFSGGLYVSITSIHAEFALGAISSHEAGLAFGSIGLIAGMSLAVMGYIANKFV